MPAWQSQSKPTSPVCCFVSKTRGMIGNHVIVLGDFNTRMAEVEIRRRHPRYLVVVTERTLTFPRGRLSFIVHFAICKGFMLLRICKAVCQVAPPSLAQWCRLLRDPHGQPLVRSLHLWPWKTAAEFTGIHVGPSPRPLWLGSPAHLPHLPHLPWMQGDLGETKPKSGVLPIVSSARVTAFRSD